jgi:hypothetical protein
MKPFKAIALVLLLLPTLAPAQKKPKKSSLPAVFGQARYVYVEAIDGSQFRPDLYPGDRDAIANVQQALQKWGRYALTMDRSQADLVFIVRKGRLASANVGYSTVGLPGRQGAKIPGQAGPMGSSVSAGGEGGPKDDLLEVCQIDPDGTLGVPLWIRSQQDGLDAPNVALIRELKTAVDRTYPPGQASGKRKP